MTDSTKVALSLELFEGHQMVHMNSREELEKAKKIVAEFLDSRVGWTHEVIPVDLNMFNSDRGRPEGQFETVVQAIFMVNIEATGDDVAKVADQWEAFARSKKYKNAWWELFDVQLRDRVLETRRKQKESSDKLRERVAASVQKRKEDRASQGYTPRAAASSAPVDIDFADDDLI